MEFNWKLNGVNMKEQVLHAQQSREAHVKHMFRCAEPLPKQPKVPAWRTHPAAVPPTLPGTTNVSLYSATLEAIIKGVSQRIAALAGTASSEIGSLESSGKASPSSPCSGRYGYAAWSCLATLWLNSILGM